MRERAVNTMWNDGGGDFRIEHHHWLAIHRHKNMKGHKVTSPMKLDGPHYGTTWHMHFNWWHSHPGGNQKHNEWGDGL